MKNYTQYPTHIITDLIPQNLLKDTTIKLITNIQADNTKILIKMEYKSNKALVFHTIPISKIKEQLYLAQ
jgi:hypothetical protein